MTTDTRMVSTGVASSVNAAPAFRDRDGNGGAGRRHQPGRMGAASEVPADSRPVVSGPVWFETEDRPFGLLIEVPFAADVMAAALYDLTEYDRRHLANDDNVRGFIAVALVVQGIGALECRADELADPAAVDRPVWLAFCQQRVQEVMESSVIHP